MEEENLVNSSPMPGKGQAPKKMSDTEIFNLVHSNTKRPSQNFFKGQTNNVYYNTGFGKSKYDKDFNFETEFNEYDPQGSLNEHRAQSQPWQDKAALGIARAATKAATEVFKLPGVVGGLIASVTPLAEDNHRLDMAFNNSWIKALDSINESINTEALPVYVKKSVKDGDIWDNLSSVDFWATDGADGVGFIAAMMVPGVAFEYAALGGKLINGAAKAAKFTKMAESTEGALSALKGLGITGKSVDAGLAVTGNTVFEAGAEAKGVGDSMDRQRDDKINKYISSGMSKEQAELKFNSENPNYTEQRAIAMRDNFLFNAAVLVGPNAIMHKAIWGKAGKTYELAAEKGKEALLKRIGKSAERVGEAFLSEGAWEEGLQTTSENYFSNKGMKGELGNGLQKNDLGDFAKIYIQMALSTEGQKAMVLGGLLGGVMTSYQGRKGDVENIKQTNSVINHINERFNSFNTKFDEEIYKKDKNGDFIFKKDENGNPTNQREVDPKGVLNVAKSLNYTEQQSALFDLAVTNGDEKVVNQLKQKAIFDLILPSIYNGEMGISVLENKLKEDAKFNEIVENDQFSDDKNSSKQFIKETLDTAKYLQKQNEKFEDFSKDIIDLSGVEHTEEQKTKFIDALNQGYLNVKHNLRQEQISLDKLKDKRANLLEDIGMSKELVTEDELLVNAEKTNPILKKINDNIRESEENISKYNKDIADIWGNKEITKKAFEDFVKEDNEETEELSPESEIGFEDVKEKIKSIESKEDLVKYTKSLDKKYKDNPDIQLDIQDHYKRLDEIEKTQNDIDRIQKLNEDKDKFHDDSLKDDDSNSSKTSNSVDKQIVAEQKTIQSSDIAEVTNDNENIEEDEKSDLNQNTDEIYDDLYEGKNQSSAKIISTNRATGESLPGLESFVKYEKETRDKTSDKVSFDYGDFNENNNNDKKCKLIVDNIINGNIVSTEDVAFLEKYLPIKTSLSNEGTNAYSYIETMGSSSESIVEKETLPLRKAIVSELVKNKGSFKGIEGKVEKQFPGILKLGIQGSNVLELDVFKGMSEKEKIDYFKKNSVYVSNKGVVKYCSTDLEDPNKTMKSSNRGEVFLKIPQINGKMFYLKLNTSKLSNKKAEDILDLIILKSNLLNNKEEMSFDELLDFMEQNDINSLSKEIDLIKRNSDTIDQTLERLINLVVFSQNTNAKTKLILGNDGTLVLGELLHKVNSQIPEWSGQLESYTYTNETLNNLTAEQFNAIRDYLTYKRHNVIITDSGSFTTFSNDEYVKYLLGLEGDYPILTTNAAVNEPTFGGYSNIYLSQSVSNSNKPQVSAEKASAPTVNVENTEDFLDSLEDLYGEDVVETVTVQVKPKEKEDVVDKSENQSTNESKVDQIKSEDKFKSSDTQVMHYNDEDGIRTITEKIIGNLKIDVAEWTEYKGDLIGTGINKSGIKSSITETVYNTNIYKGFEKRTLFFHDGEKRVEFNRVGVGNLQGNEEDYIKEVIENKNLNQLINYISIKENKLIKSENLKEIFEKSNDKDKAKILAITAKQLGMMDKVNPKEIESSFNNLYEALKENKTLQDDIKKICGI